MKGNPSAAGGVIPAAVSPTEINNRNREPQTATAKIIHFGTLPLSTIELANFSMVSSLRFPNIFFDKGPMKLEQLDYVVFKTLFKNFANPLWASQIVYLILYQIIHMNTFLQIAGSPYFSNAKIRDKLRTFTKNAIAYLIYMYVKESFCVIGSRENTLNALLTETTDPGLKYAQKCNEMINFVVDHFGVLNPGSGQMRMHITSAYIRRKNILNWIRDIKANIREQGVWSSNWVGKNLGRPTTHEQKCGVQSWCSGQLYTNARLLFAIVPRLKAECLVVHKKEKLRMSDDEIKELNTVPQLF